MRNFIFATLFAMALVAGAASAQVAVPKINTAGRDLATSNPASTVWGSPSSIEVSKAQGTLTDVVGGVRLPATKASESFYGFRIVPEKGSWAFAADTNYGKYPNDQRRGSLGLKLGERLGLGFGVTTNRSTNIPSVDNTENYGGLSFALSETFYLGYVYGREFQNDSTAPEEKRDFSRYGLGLRGGSDKGMMYHLEYNFDVYLPDTSTSKKVGEHRSQSVIEVVFNNVLLAWERKYSNPSGVGVDLQTGTIGYSPREGFSINYFATQGQLGPSTGTHVDASLSGVSLALLF
ncbi:MAG: hypothetical protein OEV94_02515 [Deltaproteobacteria bacterium]|nr:hypothetical protein [Deltaproteobacteria bacterium]